MITERVMRIGLGEERGQSSEDSNKTQEELMIVLYLTEDEFFCMNF